MTLGWIVKTDRGLDWTDGVDALLGLQDRSFRASLELLLSFVDPADEAALRLLREGSGHLDEPLAVRLLRRDGAVRHVRLCPCETLPGEGSLVLGVDDLEAAREREAALATAEALRAAAFETMFDGLLILDRRCRVLQANVGGRRGLPRDPLGSILWDVYPAAVGGRFWKHVQDVLATRMPIEDEHLSPALGGWISYRLSPFRDGLLCVCRDVGRVHQLGALLDDLAERVGLAAAGGHMALWQLDLRSDRIWLSDDARDLLGSGQIARKAFLDGVHDEDRARVRRAIETATEARGRFEVAFRYRREGEGERRLCLRGEFAPALVDRPNRLAGIVLDMESEDRATGDPSAGARTGTSQSARDLTGAQVRAARGLLRWSVRELSERSGVSVATINRIETGDGVPSARGTNLVALHAALVAAGARFLETGEREPAVALARGDDRGAEEILAAGERNAA